MILVFALQPAPVHHNRFSVPVEDLADLAPLDAPAWLMLVLFHERTQQVVLLRSPFLFFHFCRIESIYEALADLHFGPRLGAPTKQTSDLDPVLAKYFDADENAYVLLSRPRTKLALHEEHAVLVADLVVAPVRKVRL